MNKTKLLTILAFILAALFLMTGSAKFLMGQASLDQFEGWGYPPWFAYVTGALEITAGILLILRRTRFYGAALGVVIMVGAAITHIKEPEVGLLPLGIPMLAACSWIAWSLRPVKS
jgi:uncharacterized membrane protein YphA (DoxX/SURF4 family)